jgi:hypothetical protein
LKDSGIIIIICTDTDFWQKNNNKWGHLNTYIPGEHTVMLNKKSFERLIEKFNSNNIKNNSNLKFNIEEFKQVQGADCFCAVLKKDNS